MDNNFEERIDIFLQNESLKNNKQSETQEAAKRLQEQRDSRYSSMVLHLRNSGKELSELIKKEPTVDDRRLWNYKHEYEVRTIRQVEHKSFWGRKRTPPFVEVKTQSYSIKGLFPMVDFGEYYTAYISEGLGPMSDVTHMEHGFSVAYTLGYSALSGDFMFIANLSNEIPSLELSSSSPEASVVDQNHQPINGLYWASDRQLLPRRFAEVNEWGRLENIASLCENQLVKIGAYILNRTDMPPYRIKVDIK